MIRDVLVRVDPRQLDDALRAWTAANGGTDSALAIDGKTMRGAIDDDGRQTHVLGIVGHDTGVRHGKKVGMRAGADQEEKRTNEIGTVIPLLDTLPDSALAGRVVTVDALLTQRALADQLLERGAAFLFTVKGNQKTLMDDIRLLMDEAMAECPRTSRKAESPSTAASSGDRSGRPPRSTTTSGSPASGRSSPSAGRSPWPGPVKGASRPPAGSPA